jgi:hypothetical protein
MDCSKIVGNGPVRENLFAGIMNATAEPYPNEL